jgi:hypothetical protein
MTACVASAEVASLRRFVDAVIELNEKPTPGNVARYLRASGELERSTDKPATGGSSRKRNRRAA